MKKWTVDAVLACKPCPDYTRERLEKLSRGRVWTTREILDREDIPAADRVWLACQKGAITVKQRKQWLDVIVGRAVTTYASYCDIPEVEVWAARWLSNVDRTAGAAGAVDVAVWEVGAAGWAAEYRRQLVELRAILSC